MSTELAEAIIELEQARRQHEELRHVEPVSPEAYVQWRLMLARSRSELRRMGRVVEKMLEEVTA